MPPSEQELRQAIATAEQVLAGGVASPYPRELYPELDRRRASRQAHAFAAQAEPPAAVAQPRPVAATPAADGDVTLSPENVARWSAELGFTRSASAGRVTRADD